MTIRDELSTLKPKSSSPRGSAKRSWRLPAAIADRDFQAVAIFTALGLLVSFNVILRFSDCVQAVVEAASMF
jgi:hypothetical protein